MDPIQTKEARLGGVAEVGNWAGQHFVNLNQRSLNRRVPLVIPTKMAFSSKMVVQPKTTLFHSFLRKYCFYREHSILKKKFGG